MSGWQYRFAILGFCLWQISTLKPRLSAGLFHFWFIALLLQPTLPVSRRAFYSPGVPMEPTSTAAGALLAKYGVALAGFAGAVLSLTFLRGLTRKQAAAAVVTGFLSAIFTTALVVQYFKLPTDADSQNGVAFLIGLLAMNIIPGLKALAGQISSVRGSGP